MRNRKNVDTLFPYQNKSGKILLDIFIDSNKNDVSYTITTSHLKPSTKNTYNEFYNVALTIDSINFLFDRIDFRIKEDLLIRSDDPNYFGIIELKVTDDSNLYSFSKVSSISTIEQTLALARSQTLVAANKVISQRPCYIM